MTHGSRMRRLLISVCCLVVAGAAPARALVGGAPAERADSLYRAGREALARREYRGAAELFAQVVAGYPTAAVAGNARYWRAYALYVAGNSARNLGELRDARAALDTEVRLDAQALLAHDGLDLRARVIAAEASLGDPGASGALATATSALARPISCGDGDLALALVALERMIDRDPEAAMPTVRRVLSTQGSCMDRVRRSTVVLLATTPGMNANVVVAELARADGALQAVPAAIPPIRPLGPIVRVSRDSLASISEIRVLSDGRVLANESGGDRVVLFDSSLAHFTTVVDANGPSAKAYGAQGGSLFPYRSDSSLYADQASLSFLVIDPAGQIARIMAAPLIPGYPGGLIYLLQAAVDPQGNVVSRWGKASLARMGANASGASAGRSGGAGVAGATAPAPTDPSRPEVTFDSDAVIRMNIATKKMDTAVWLMDPPRATVAIPGTTGRLPLSNTLPVSDTWTMMPDGTIAALREHDYHVDWVAPNGTVTSTPKIAHEWVAITDSMKLAIIDSVRRLDSAAIDRMRANKARANGGQAGGGAGVGSGSAGRSGIGTMGFFSGPGGMRMITTSVDGIAVDPQYMDPDLLPSYFPPFPQNDSLLLSSPLRADADGHLWIRVNLPRRPEGGFVYDVVDRHGMLIDRVQIPGGTNIIGFGPGVAYLISREGASYALARAKIH